MLSHKHTVLRLSSLTPDAETSLDPSGENATEVGGSE